MSLRLKVGRLLQFAVHSQIEILYIIPLALNLFNGEEEEHCLLTSAPPKTTTYPFTIGDEEHCNARNTTSPFIYCSLQPI